MPAHERAELLLTTGDFPQTQIGLGVLNIPDTFHTLGMAPGVIILIVIAILTTWTDYYIGIFKLKHPTVCESALPPRISPLADSPLPTDSVSDCGALMFGRVGREIFGIGYWLRTSMPGLLAKLRFRD